MPAASAGTRAARTWTGEQPPRYVVMLCHGYGEHVGRYEHVAPVVDDLHVRAGHAVERDPEPPVVLVAHSMGGMIAARYAQRHADTLAALVLSGPVLGRRDPALHLLALQAIAECPDAITAAGSLGDLPTLWGARRHEVLNATNRDEVFAVATGFVDDVLGGDLRE